MLVGGLFLVVDDIPYYFYWLLYISPFFYAFMPLSINEFDGVTFSCSESDLVNGVCPYVTGEDVIRRLNFDKYHLWIGPVCLIAIYFILRVLTYLALVLLARKKSST
jgi:hypothetical protein